MSESVLRSLEQARRGPSPAESTSEPLMRDLIGDLLRRTRVEQGRTLREVAEDAQVSLPYLSEIERGRKEASSELLAAVYRSLGLSITEVLGELYQRTTLFRMERAGSRQSPLATASPTAPAHQARVLSLAA